MQSFKERWEIEKNWQLIFPLLGIIGLLFSGYLIANAILKGFTAPSAILLAFLSFIVAYGLLNITLKLFNRLQGKWTVKYRWELIAIFIVFAITGSTSARISGPFTESIGLAGLIDNRFLFWLVRILIIFPIYQVLLIIIGWLFGQFKFFWAFEKKMLKRMGFKRFFNE